MIPVLETHLLSIGYTAPHKAPVVIAEDIQVSLQSGELVCLLGANGVGKSTLMRTIAHMQKPLAGHVMISGDDLQALKPRQLAGRLSIVLTERPNLGLLNGYALVALGRHPYTNWTGRLTRYDKAVIRWAVEAVDAMAFADRPVMDLSDGQRQKLMIARALAQESELIILDEPTAFLDLPRRVEIMNLLRYLAAEAGRAILLSTHDLDLALRSADKLWLMSNGKIQAGTPEDLVLNGAFEAAFPPMAFDRATGSFGVERAMQHSVSVSGHGVTYTWTCRALQRSGFTVEEDAEVCVEVIDELPNPLWHIHQASGKTTHHSINDVLEALNLWREFHGDYRTTEAS